MSAITPVADSLPFDRLRAFIWSNLRGLRFDSPQKPPRQKKKRKKWRQIFVELGNLRTNENVRLAGVLTVMQSRKKLPCFYNEISRNKKTQRLNLSEFSDGKELLTIQYTTFSAVLYVLYCVCVCLYNQFSSFSVVPQLSSCN